MTTLQKISELIQAEDNFVILPHIFGDGDCIGSSFALYNALQKLGKRVVVVLEEHIPEVYSFLPGEYVKLSDMQNEYEFNVAICLDSGDEDRIHDRLHFVHDSNFSINIDHHVTNTLFAQNNYVDTNSAATGEIIYDLIQLLDVPVDKAIATNLYVAIVTDTGGFRYSNTTPRTHQIAASLLMSNIDIASINRKVFETVSLEKLKMTSDAIHHLELYEEGKIAIIVLDYNMLQRAGVSNDETDGLSTIPRTIEGVEVGIVLLEKELNKVKVSFRSNEYIDVSEIAASFNGGGHARASGCTLGMNCNTAKQKVLEAVKKRLNVDS